MMPTTRSPEQAVAELDGIEAALKSSRSSSYTGGREESQPSPAPSLSVDYGRLAAARSIVEGLQIVLEGATDPWASEAQRLVEQLRACLASEV